MTQADDPWAKWRQPAGSAAPAAEKAEPPVPEKSAPARARPAKAPERPVADKRPADEGAADLEVKAEVKTKPAGTLGVKAGLRSEAPGKRTPLRGGSPVRKPMTAAAPLERPAARPVKKAAAPVVRSGPPPEGTRLSKVMSERGMCSRREADLWIERGWVFVNGEQVSELGSRIDPDARIEVSTEAKKDQAKAVTILLHKPVGYVSGQPEPGCIPAVTLITAENQVPQSGGPEFKPWMLRGLAPAGRLDVDSTGLLVLTSDGRVAKRLIGEDSDAEKEYLVRVSGEMIKGGLELLRHGLELDGKALKPAWVKQLNEDQLHFILKEGKKRQIRRMCELVGLKVVGLKRVRIGRIRLGDLPMGQWRFLRTDEAF